LVTACPTATLTAVTWPETEKLRLSWAAGATVPVAVTLCLIVEVVTVCVVVAGTAAALVVRVPA
jgi:hypothetical protein